MFKHSLVLHFRVSLFYNLLIHIHNIHMPGSICHMVCIDNPLQVFQVTTNKYGPGQLVQSVGPGI